ncbi:helix-turn-helix domain-containing protein [Knoellia sp. CPCC 206453]|uniref:helix-turn-helix domain-containing protein n=1 Tax=Knoellia pratensis TaxID=3404796 RepID=UPI00360A002D
MTLSELRTSDRAVITVTEAAALLEVDERTVRRACVDGQLPHVRVGVRILILRQQLVDLLDTPAALSAPQTESAGTLRLLQEERAS